MIMSLKNRIPDAEYDVEPDKETPVRLIRCISGDVVIVSESGRMVGCLTREQMETRTGFNWSMFTGIVLIAFSCFITYLGFWKFCELVFG